MQNRNRIKSALKLYIIMLLGLLFTSGCRKQDSLISGSGIQEIVENNTEDYQSLLEIVENNTEDNQSTLEIDVLQDSIIKVKVYNQEDYSIFLKQLENYNNYHLLYLDLCDTDTVIYLDELLQYQNFGYLQIENGGIICTKDTISLETSSLWEIELCHISMIQENLLNQLGSIKQIRILLDNRYTGRLPTVELINNTVCENIVLMWDSGNDLERNSKLNGQDTYDGNSKEWEFFYSVLPKENQCLRGLYRINQDNYSYTSYEFYGAELTEACAAFVCVKDNESNGKKYFDILEIPKSALQNISKLDGKRIYLEGINFDGCKDLLYLGYNDRVNIYHKCIGFLWDNSKKRYRLCETVPSDFKMIDQNRERLVYSTSGSAFDDQYYIYKYNGNEFEEERLEVEIPQAEGAVIWRYFKDGEFRKKLEVDYDKNNSREKCIGTIRFRIR